MSEPHFHPAADGTGPGLNSGYILEEMIGGALKQNCHLAAMNAVLFRLVRYICCKGLPVFFFAVVCTNDGCFP